MTDSMNELRQAIAEKLLNVEGVLFDFMLKGYTVTAVCRKPNEPNSFVIVSNDTPPFMDALEKAHKENIHKDWANSGWLGVLEDIEKARRELEL